MASREPLNLNTELILMSVAGMGVVFAGWGAPVSAIWALAAGIIGFIAGLRMGQKFEKEKDQVLRRERAMLAKLREARES